MGRLFGLRSISIGFYDLFGNRKHSAVSRQWSADFIQKHQSIAWLQGTMSLMQNICTKSLAPSWV
ncbi:hypothetical protein LYNGBM3L_63220 [Moorena producens 3L]|uniref:Uncharacterized protein n=1 Tax=Moorena producens 3L TaxID=489825 RepID=F4Y126_9CYAN|nr:hypothetical protein LYNGBM3L_63220 [Moorena producens 3L]OLT67984.1 hypothetical protein BI334_25800 [Moorena producens 3L]